jgi:hypothetical protein
VAKTKLPGAWTSKGPPNLSSPAGKVSQPAPFVVKGPTPTPSGGPGNVGSDLTKPTIFTPPWAAKGYKPSGPKPIA